MYQRQLELLKDTRQEQKVQVAHNKDREAGFKQTERSIRAQRDALIAQRNQLQKETEQLSDTFSDNENKLAILEEQLRLETGSLGELFGVVRQTAKDVKAELDTSVTAVDRHQNNAVIDVIVDAKVLPSLPQLTGLWLAMQEQIQASGELANVDVDYINGEGHKSQLNAYRLGSIGMVAEQGYIEWDGAKQSAKPLLKATSEWSCRC